MLPFLVFRLLRVMCFIIIWTKHIFHSSFSFISSLSNLGAWVKNNVIPFTSVLLYYVLENTYFTIPFLLFCLVHLILELRWKIMLIFYPLFVFYCLLEKKKTFRHFFASVSSCSCNVFYYLLEKAHISPFLFFCFALFVWCVLLSSR